MTLLVGVIAVPAFVLVVALILQAYQNQRAAVAKELANTTRAVASVVDGEIEECVALLNTLASTQSLAMQDWVSLDTVARRAIPEEGRWFVLVDETGQEFINTRVPRGAPLPKINFAPEYVASMKAKTLYVSNMVFGPVAQKPVVLVARHYQHESGAQYGLALVMDPQYLAQQLQVRRYAPAGVLSVTDRRGQIIVRSRDPEKYVGGTVTPDIVELVKLQKESIAESVTLEGIPVLAAVAPSQHGWAVAIGVPNAQLYAASRHLLFIGLGGAAFVALLVSLIALWISRALVRSMDALTQDAERMAHGELPDARSSGLQEADFVADAMRRTAATLFRRTRVLETLNHASGKFVASREREQLERVVTDAAREITGATGAAFVRSDSDSGSGALVYASSEAARQFFQAALARGWTEIPSHPSTSAIRRFDAATLSGASAPNFRVGVVIAVVARGGAVCGRLLLASEDAAFFNQEVEQIALGLVAQAEIALENAQLYADLGRELEAKSAAEAELRRAQARLREHAEDLEKKVEERTASLREAVAQMEEFSYTVSHDLRSPLRAISGYAAVLLEDYAPSLDEVARDYLLRIRRSSERMDQLTTDVLKYSRVARAEARPELVDLEKVVRGVVEHYRELQADVADVTLVTPMGRVLGHEQSLNQSLANLLTNAAKFVRPGERPKITVRTEPRESRLRIWVEDQGIGIPGRHQDRLFRIFERAPTANDYAGTGVGLAIVRKAVEKMGGQCGVESDGQTGSRFWIELPVA